MTYKCENVLESDKPQLIILSMTLISTLFQIKILSRKLLTILLVKELHIRLEFKVIKFQ